MGTTRVFRWVAVAAFLVALAPAAAGEALAADPFVSVGTRDAGVGRAAALRAAQARLLNDQATSHPAFWAPFVLVGDGGTP